MERKNHKHQVTKISVVGVGSGGLAAVDALMDAGIYGVDHIAVDTNLVDLRNCQAPTKLRIGRGFTSQISGSPFAEQGQRAALISAESISAALRGSDLVFIVCGLGGCVGSGVSPIVARIASEQNALVVGIVTYPFANEGRQRAEEANKGVKWLRKWTDTLVVIPNDRLLQLANGAVGVHQTYQMAFTIWQQAIDGINDLVNNPGLINVDFADVRAIMAQGGGAIMATGHGKGKNRARLAAERATQSDVLGLTIHGASGLIFNVSGGRDMSLHEVEMAARIITAKARPMANVIFGATIDPMLEGEMHTTVLATGFKYRDINPRTVDRVARQRSAMVKSQPWQLNIPKSPLSSVLFDSQPL